MNRQVYWLTKDGIVSQSSARKRCFFRLRAWIRRKTAKTSSTSKIIVRGITTRGDCVAISMLPIMETRKYSRRLQRVSEHVLFDGQRGAKIDFDQGERTVIVNLRLISYLEPEFVCSMLYQLYEGLRPCGEMLLVFPWQ